MMEKTNQVVDTGEIVCGFGVRKDYQGQKDFDECYKEVTIKQRVKRVGDGENDFIIEEYEEVKEIPIREVIDQQVDNVGIEAYLRPYEMQGVDLFKSFTSDVTDKVDDYSQFPDDPKLSQDVYGDMMKIWQGLDPMLKGSSKSPEDFLRSLTDERLKAYYEAKLNVEKVEEK